MYRNINNYYFNRPNYGYAYANPYGMNFSRSYPRVVIYNGQQNFGVIDSLKKHGKKAALLSGALLAAGIPGAQDLGKNVGELVRVPQTYTITHPMLRSHNRAMEPFTNNQGEDEINLTTTDGNNNSFTNTYFLDSNGRISYSPFYKSQLSIDSNSIKNFPFEKLRNAQLNYIEDKYY